MVLDVNISIDILFIIKNLLIILFDAFLSVQELQSITSTHNSVDSQTLTLTMFQIQLQKKVSRCIFQKQNPTPIQ